MAPGIWNSSLADGTGSHESQGIRKHELDGTPDSAVHANSTGEVLECPGCSHLLAPRAETCTGVQAVSSLRSPPKVGRELQRSAESWTVQTKKEDKHGILGWELTRSMKHCTLPSL